MQLWKSPLLPWDVCGFGKAISECLFPWLHPDINLHWLQEGCSIIFNSALRHVLNSQTSPIKFWFLWRGSPWGHCLIIGCDSRRVLLSYFFPLLLLGTWWVYSLSNYSSESFNQVPIAFPYTSILLKSALMLLPMKNSSFGGGFGALCFFGFSPSPPPPLGRIFESWPWSWD